MAAAGRRIYIGRIPPDASRSDVEKYFGRYGSLMDVRIMAGFGFLEYDSVRDAEDAVHDLNGRDFMGERLIVEFAKAPRGRDTISGGGGRGRSGGGGGYVPRGSGFRVLVRGLSHDTSWQDLKDFARQAGNVTRADVDRNSPGEGLIEYISQDDAENAIRKLDGTELKGLPVTLIEDRVGGGGRGGRDRSRSRSPGYHRDSRNRDRSSRDRSRDRERDRSPRERRGGYGRDRRRSPPLRDDRPPRDDRSLREDRDLDWGRSHDRKERERSPRRETCRTADSTSKKSFSD